MLCLQPCMRRICRAILCVLFGTAIPATRPDEPSGATDQFVSAYVLISSADDILGNLWKQTDPARKSEMQTDALQRYETALRSLQSIQERSPDWKPEVVAFRIRYCQEKIATLKAKTDAATSSPSPPAAAPVVPPSFSAADPLRQLADTLQNYQADLAAKTQQISDLQARLTRSEEEKTSLATRMQQINSTLASYAQRIQLLERDLAALDQTRQLLNVAREETAALRAQLEETQRSEQHIAAKLRQTELAEQTAQDLLRAVQARVDALQQEAAEGAQAKLDLERARSERAALQAQVAEERQKRIELAAKLHAVTETQRLAASSTAASEQRLAQLERDLGTAKALQTEVETLRREKIALERQVDSEQKARVELGARLETAEKIRRQAAALAVANAEKVKQLEQELADARRDRDELSAPANPQTADLLKKLFAARKAQAAAEDLAAANAAHAAQWESTAAELRRQLQAAESQLKAMERQKQVSEPDVETIQSELNAAKVSLAEAEKQAREAEARARKAEKVANSLRAEADRLAVAESKQRDAATAAVREIAVLREALAKERSDREASEKELALMRAAAETLQQQIKTMQLQSDQARQAAAASREERSKRARNGVEQLEAQVLQLEQHSLRLQEELQRLRQTLQEREAALEAQRLASAEIKARMEAMRAQWEQTRGEGSGTSSEELAVLRYEEGLLSSAIAKQQGQGPSGNRPAEEQLVADLRQQIAALEAELEISRRQPPALSDEELAAREGASADKPTKLTAFSPKLLRVEGSRTALAGISLPVSSLPPSLAALEAEARELREARRFDAAAAKYEQLLQQAPNHPLVLTNLAILRVHQDRAGEALELAEQSRRAGDKHSGTHTLLGILYLGLGRYDDAVGSLARAALLDNRNVTAHYQLGIAYALRGQPWSAEQQFRRALELDPNLSNAHFNLAVIYSRQDPPQMGLARYHYVKAIKLGAVRDVNLEELLAPLPPLAISESAP